MRLPAPWTIREGCPVQSSLRVSPWMLRASSVRPSMASRCCWLCDRRPAASISCHGKWGGTQARGHAFQGQKQPRMALKNLMQHNEQLCAPQVG